MKKSFGLLLMFIFVLQSFADEPINSSTLKLNSTLFNKNSLSLSPTTDYDLSIMNLQFDVLGFVFFGPQISLDFQFANILAVGPFFRYNYAGIIYHVVVTDGSEKITVLPASYGTGIQAKALIPLASGKNRLYAGFSYERYKGEEENDDYSGVEITKSNIYMFNFGYRILGEGSFNLSIGAGLGLYKELDIETDFGNIEGDKQFIGIVQLTLGWQLGK